MSAPYFSKGAIAPIATPLRIISLVPSQTELLFHLGLETELVGNTKFCIHPNEWFRNKKRIGGTKDIQQKTIEQLTPTLILANKEENVKEQVEALEKIAPVYVSEITTLDDALQMISDIGRLTNKELEAAAIAAEISENFVRLNPKAHINLTTAYLIWRNPYMAAGGDTFIDDLMHRCGFKNVFAEVDRYPMVTIDQLSKTNCELLLLSSEPYPFKQKHIDELQQQLPQTKIMLVDGEMFSWYGSRLIQAPAYFETLLKNIGSNPVICSHDV